MDKSSSFAKRLWHMIRVVYYMLRKGLSKHKITMDLHLLLKRGKIAGKAIGNLMTFHGHHHHHQQKQHASSNIYAGFSCRSMDPNLSFYNPKEVEFSCSNTPAFPHFRAAKRRNGHRHDLHNYDVAMIAKAFEILNSELSDAESVVASPSPAPLWSFGKSPAVRQLWITDSPFPIMEEEDEEEAADGKVDREAEDFIKRFYEQLRLQQMVPPTPEYSLAPT